MLFLFKKLYTNLGTKVGVYMWIYTHRKDVKKIHKMVNTGLGEGQRTFFHLYCLSSL